MSAMEELYKRDRFMRKFVVVNATEWNRFMWWYNADVTKLKYKINYKEKNGCYYDGDKIVMLENYGMYGERYHIIRHEYNVMPEDYAIPKKMKNRESKLKTFFGNLLTKD